MRLYLLTQDVARGYDTYDSCVVAAESPEDAATIHPRGYELPLPWEYGGSWASNPSDVKVEFLGLALDHIKRGVICASFNAG